MGTFLTFFCSSNWNEWYVSKWQSKGPGTEFTQQNHSEDINQHQEREEWMILADVSNHNSNDNEGLANYHNWHIHTTTHSAYTSSTFLSICQDN